MTIDFGFIVAQSNIAPDDEYVELEDGRGDEHDPPLCYVQ